MRLILTLVILSITSISIAFGQSNDTSSANKSEKNNTTQTESSSYFYINERGLAVYSKNPINGANYETDTLTTKTFIKKDSDLNTNKNENSTTNKTNSNQDTNIEKRTTSFFIKKDAKSTTVSSVPKETATVNKNIISELPSPSKEVVLQPKETDKEEVSAIKTTPGKKKSVFDHKRESQYKTLEEAALAVEALLEDLKKDQQAHSSSAGSMSVRLSRGANKSLRKNDSAPTYNISNSKANEISKTTISEGRSKKIEENSKNIISDEFDNLPSYFINGQQVDKAEVDRLRKKDIISKEVRIRNTVTGNPNGEVWYEIR